MVVAENLQNFFQYIMEKRQRFPAFEAHCVQLVSPIVVLVIFLDGQFK